MVVKNGVRRIRAALYVEVDGDSAVATNEPTTTESEGQLVLNSNQVLVWTGEKQPTIDNSRTLIYDPLPTVTADGVMIIEE